MSVECPVKGALPLNLQGRGTADDPWKIRSTAEILLLQNTVNSGNTYEGQVFTLVENLVLADDDKWGGLGEPQVKSASTNSPYVYGGTGFAGTFDGNGHTITIYRTANAPGNNIQQVVGGLVNYLAPSGVVKNVTIAGYFTVTGAMDAVGGVVGYNSGAIEHVTNYAVVTAVSAFNVGGIAGFNNGCYNLAGEPVGRDSGEGAPVGEISHCMNHGSILGCRKVGGITGEDAGIIGECDNLSNITGDYASKDGVGGIAGRTGNNNKPVETGKIINCANFGNISDVKGAWVGGLTGELNDPEPSNGTSLADGGNSADQADILVGYSINNVTSYSYRDNSAGADDSGEIEDTYGPRASDGGFGDNHAQHYDGTILLVKSQMTDDGSGGLLAMLNEDDESIGEAPAWEMKQIGDDNYPVPIGCGNTKSPSEPSPEPYVINVIKNPNVLTYMAGEDFDPAGLVVQAIYANGQRVTLDLSQTATIPTAELQVNAGDKESEVTIEIKVKYGNESITFPFEVVVYADYENTSGKVVLDPGVKGCWGTLQGALKAALAKGQNTIYVAGTAALVTQADGYGESSTINVLRDDQYTDVMFTIADEADYNTDADPNTVNAVPSGSSQAVEYNVTMKYLTIKGTNGGAASLIRLDSGELTLEQSVTLEDNTIPAAAGSRTSRSSWKSSAAQRGAGLSVQGGAANCAGTIQNCKTTSGGGLHVAGTLNLSGSITQCSATDGSAAYVQGTLIIQDGAVISGNSAEQNGTILVAYDETNEQPGEVVIQGGAISNNTAPEGSILFVQGGKATIKGGALSGGPAGVYVGVYPVMKDGKLKKTSIGQVIVNDGSISKDTDNSDGADARAAVVVDGGKFELTGGTVQHRICVGNTLVTTDVELKTQEIITGELLLSGGEVLGGGQSTALTLNGGKCTMSTGKIFGSIDPNFKAVSRAVCVDSATITTAEGIKETIKGVFTMAGGEIFGGELGNDGKLDPSKETLAAVRIDGGEFVMVGGEIKYGSKHTVSVGCKVRTDFQTKESETIIGEFLMQNGTITGSANVPAVDVCSGEFTLQGGTIIAGTGGYAIRVTSSETSKFTIDKNATIDGSIYLESGAYINLNVALTSTINVVVPEGTPSGTVIAICNSSRIVSTNAAKIMVNGVKASYDDKNIIVPR